MKKISKILFLLVASTATLVSCSDKDKIDELKDSTDSTNTVASLNIEAANNLDVQTGLDKTNDGTVSKTTANATYPKEFNVDFGTGTTINGITRKGKLRITITAPINQSGSKMTIERIDYYINGNKLEGSIDYTNTTPANKTPEWLRSVNNGKFININGKIFLNSGSCIIKQTAGVDTLDLTDNTYEMTQGQHTVTNEAGDRATLSVEETLVKNYSCDYISKGKLKIDGALLNGVVDYGTGACDNQYTFTLKNGTVFNLEMK